MRKKSIAVIAYSQISTDARVIREVKAACESGFNVDLYTLKENNSFSIEGINIIRSNQFQKRGKFISYIISYFRFFIFCIINISIKQIKMEYKICHVNNMPNFLVFSCLIPKLFGAKIILDVHDLMEELMEMRFKNKSFSKLLKYEERISAKFADIIISVNHLHEERFRKNRIRKKVIPILNISDFKATTIGKKNFDSKIIKIVYAATITKDAGIETLIYAIDKLKNKNNNFKLFIFGDGPYLQESVSLVANLKLEKFISFSKRMLNFDELFSEYKNAHIGIVPTSKNKLTDLCVGAKISEYFANKIAAILSNTRSNNYYFSKCAVLFKAGDSNDLADKIFMLLENRKLLKTYAEKGHNYYLNNPWDKYKKEYINLIQNL